MNYILNTKKTIPIILMLIGSVWAYYGIFEVTFWRGNSPGSGFFPSIIGFLLIGLSTLSFKNDFKVKNPDYSFESFYPIIGSIFSLLLSFFLDFLLLYLSLLVVGLF
ncbi:hypothetical protein L0B53_15860 [Vibrio sp. SS-MA-C1-2]|uniref:hypothetical protein n=1 Tax=Vibrio sp. SS-MA-C1-2 TaxID=2908646 RepID=UPI001F1C8D3A|nr:hypothetical protein [Vibrio sp. SS-MA-C1-2]UJF18481.1 hypothetical protein L0B53_15860 [Vibrio sp. SS-MA-C1-2]